MRRLIASLLGAATIVAVAPTADAVETLPSLGDGNYSLTFSALIRLDDPSIGFDGFYAYSGDGELLADGGVYTGSWRTATGRGSVGIPGSDEAFTGEASGDISGVATSLTLGGFGSVTGDFGTQGGSTAISFPLEIDHCDYAELDLEGGLRPLYAGLPDTTQVDIGGFGVLQPIDRFLGPEALLEYGDLRNELLTVDLDIRTTGETDIGQLADIIARADHLVFHRPPRPCVPEDAQFRHMLSADLERLLGYVIEHAAELDPLLVMAVLEAGGRALVYLTDPGLVGEARALVEKYLEELDTFDEDESPATEEERNRRLEIESVVLRGAAMGLLPRLRE